MNKEAIIGLIRHVLTFGGGFAIAKGWVDEPTLTAAVGAVVTLVGAALSVINKNKS